MQNRNKLVKIFISNISNSITHQILEKAVSKELVAEKYRKELIASFELARRYREKINPKNEPLPERDIEYIRKKVTSKVKAELLIRISKGYDNIDLNLIDELADRALKDSGII